MKYSLTKATIINNQNKAVPYFIARPVFVLFLYVLGGGVFEQLIVLIVIIGQVLLKLPLPCDYNRARKTQARADDDRIDQRMSQ